MSKRTGIMLASMFTEKLFNKMEKPVLVQAKIEGDRLRAKITPEDIRLLSSGCKEIISVPHIGDEIAKSKLMNIELDGELYRHGMRHSEIRSIVSRTKNIHPDHKLIQYHVFDVVASNKQYERSRYLGKIFKKYNFRYLKYVPVYQVYTLEGLQRYYDAFVTQGYEGVIIREYKAGYKRRKVSTLLKLKPRVSESFSIIDVEEEKSIEGEPKGTFGSFTCVTYGNEWFSVGSGPTDNQRNLLWKHREYFIGETIKIRFQDYTKVRGVPKMQSIDKDWLKDVEAKLK